MEKVNDGYVKMATRYCFVDFKEYEADEILLHKQLREIPDDKTNVGWGVCPEHMEFMEGKDMICIFGVSDDDNLVKSILMTRLPFEEVFDMEMPEGRIVQTDFDGVEQLQEWAIEGGGPFLEDVME